MRLKTVFATTLLCLLAAAPAMAAPILPGNFTTVTLTSAATLTSLGITVAPTGTATVTKPGLLPVASFGITGGIANANGTLQIQHQGSGLSLSGGGTTVTLANFLVDTGALNVLANVAANGTPLSPVQIPVFNIGTGLTLTLTAGAASALDSAFMTTALTSATVIGTAATNPIIGTAVPEPATLSLLGAGLVALGATRRRQRA